MVGYQMAPIHRCLDGTFYDPVELNLLWIFGYIEVSFSPPALCCRLHVVPKEALWTEIS